MNIFIDRLLIFFATCVILCVMNKQVTGQICDSIVVCHHKEWQSDKEKVNVVKIYGGDCSREKIKRLSAYRNITHFEINDYKDSSLPIELDYPNLISLMFVDCPNLNYDSILQKVTNRRNVKTLAITKSNIEQVPEIIYSDFKHIKFLNLSSNKHLQTFRTDKGLDSLVKLSLNDCVLEVLIGGWDRYPHLVRLNMNDNEKLFADEEVLRNLSKGLKSFKTVRHISLVNTGIEVLPKELFEIEAEIYNLNENSILELPEISEASLKKMMAITINKRLLKNKTESGYWNLSFSDNYYGLDLLVPKDIYWTH